MKKLTILCVVIASTCNLLFSGDFREVSNSWITLKVDREAAGSLVWLSDNKKNSNGNLINRWDHGRYIQQSYYGRGLQPNHYPWYTWNTNNKWTWNPVEGARWNDSRNQNFRIQSESYSSDRIYVKAVAANWGSHSNYDSNNDVDHVTFEKEIKIKYDVAQISFTMRVGSGASGQVGDKWGQEMPAIFLNNKYVDTIVGDNVTTVSNMGNHSPSNMGQQPVRGSEWIAVLDRTGGYGLGIRPHSNTDEIIYYLADAWTKSDGECPGTSYLALIDKRKFNDQQGYSVNYTLYLVPGTQSYIQSRLDEIDRVGFNNISVPGSGSSQGSSFPPDESPVLNAGYYLAKYSDLRNAFGSTNYNAAVNHWYNYVEVANDPYRSEKRQGHDDFKVEYYRTNNSDLDNAFGDRWYSYFEHYKNYGVNENRLAAP